MKKILLSLGISILSVVGVNAQMTEGHVSYTISADTDDPDMQMAVSMIQGSTMEMFFKDDMARVDFNMGAMMTTSTIVDGKNEKMIMLMSGIIGKKAIPATLAELEEMNGEEEEPEIEVELLDESKKIVGYECKKAIVTDEEGTETVFWYTEDIEVNKKGQQYMNDKVPGFPLEYEMNNGGLVMTMTANDIEKKVKNSDEVFSLKVPEGYEEMTFEDLQNMGM